MGRVEEGELYRRELLTSQEWSLFPVSAMDCRWPVHVFVLWLLVFFLGGEGMVVLGGQFST